MPSRSHLTRPRPRQVIVHLGDGDDLTILYDSNRMNPAWLERAGERDAEQDPRSLSAGLSEIILEWDLTEDDGSAFPPTTDNIALLSFPIQRELLTQMMLAAGENVRAEGESSATTSSTPSTAWAETPAPRAIPQNGQATSPSPTPSGSVS